MNTPDTAHPVPGDPLWTAILQFYREELRARYQPEHLKLFPQFREVPEPQIDRLRKFFLARIYPPAPERAEIDRAFERISGILHSPRRLQPLMRSAFASAWRLGARLPQAVSTGRACFDAYRETQRLEGHLLQSAREIGLRPEDAGNRPRMLSLIAQFPEHEVRRLIRDIVMLFQALNNPDLLDTALDFMRLCVETTRKRPDLFHQEDTRAFQLGISVMEEGIALFHSLDSRQTPTLIQGIEQVELDWYQRARESWIQSQPQPWQDAEKR